uniref:uncharacterized protein LOC104265453 isoform X2 n=1 Tax=Ciona intestinalis TaxID=7719 RepID=UPI00089DD22E|nr:uncharacterized protein LOC104265453 isoform X2 [Ciona intestinalis]|eukprot:XP_018673053.1 uncharacterized protein LOC104265453 isoform X2 [Ciona intestinalis]
MTTSSEQEWRIYRKKLEMDLFNMRWYQARSFQQIPRNTRTEGSPLKPKTSHTRGALRRPPPTRAVVNRVPDDEELDPNSSTPYRLPRLPDVLPAPPKPKEYVYKQPRTATHFLIHKDPKHSSPMPTCTSPDLRIKPNSTKCRPITQNARAKILFQTWPHEGPKLHRLLPKISQPGGVVVLTDSQPKTPPQSEEEYNLLPLLDQRTERSVVIANIKDFPERVVTKFDRQLNWQLSPYTNKNFDRQGLGPNQGPFSRELPIKCMPPNTWLKMKIRHRTMGKMLS